MMKRIACLTVIGAVFALSATAWAEDQPATTTKHVASTSRTVTGKATVEAIDLATRHVSLKNDEGKTYTIVADKRVKNLAQVHVGDVVEVKYYEALAVDILPAGRRPQRWWKTPAVQPSQVRNPLVQPAGA